MGEWDWLKNVLSSYAKVQREASGEDEVQAKIRAETEQRTWWSVKEVAEYLAVDEKEFRKKVVSAGKIAITPVGERGTKIHHSDLYAYIIHTRQRAWGKNF